MQTENYEIEKKPGNIVYRGHEYVLNYMCVIKRNEKQIPSK